MQAHDIVIEPIITENSMSMFSQKKYTFKVAKSATKIDIRNAIEKLFDVKVSKVNTMNVRGQFRRQGRSEGYTSSWKKAVVTLKPGSSNISFFESLN